MCKETFNDRIGEVHRQDKEPSNIIKVLEFVQSKLGCTCHTGIRVEQRLD